MLFRSETDDRRQTRCRDGRRKTLAAALAGAGADAAAITGAVEAAGTGAGATGAGADAGTTTGRLLPLMLSVPATSNLPAPAGLTPVDTKVACGNFLVSNHSPVGRVSSRSLSPVVTDTFVRLYQQGLIYRGKRLVSWDPVLMSAVSDLEVESEEEDGHLWHICYPFADGPQTVDGVNAPGLVVATTRPETMLGDVAVAVNPEDARYTALIGTLGLRR